MAGNLKQDVLDTGQDNPEGLDLKDRPVGKGTVLSTRALGLCLR